MIYIKGSCKVLTRESVDVLSESYGFGWGVGFVIFSMQIAFEQIVGVIGDK